MRIKRHRLDTRHYLVLIHALGPKHLSLHSSIGKVDHEKDILIRQGTANDRIHRIHIHSHLRAMECLNILIEVLRNDDVGTYTPRFHLPPGLRDVGEPLHLSKLCRIKLLDKVPGCG